MANPPTGTVTFLFTDIEGSTSMWENHPGQMEAALKRHDGILRAAVEAHGGYVFKTVGDAFCAAFATAREALEATLAAQRALFAEEWDENTTVRVRMSLHTGVAEERDGDYFGPPVNRVARLLSAGHGGQVLLSSVTYGLVRDHLDYLEHGAELRDLGEHRLRDLRYTERVYQLIVPDLPSEFRPLKTHGLVTPDPATPDHTLPPDAGGATTTSREDRYLRKESIGSGGMAEVYLAHDQELDRDVALKVLRKQYADDEQFVERFKREARNAASLSHPNIVAVHDRGETEDGVYYIVMECVSGGTLKHRILKEGPLPPADAVYMALQVARALEVAHERGVIHRDVKPQNVLLTESGEAKVGDFGIARAASSSTLTKDGSIMGTAHYISPEQALGEPASPRSDLYSLGIVLYEMLTGELPHDAETPVGIIMKHVSGPPRPPIEVNPEVPESVNAIVMRLLARDPKDRYQSAAELVEDLERVQQGETSASVAGEAATPAPSSGGRARPRPKTLVAALVGLVALVGVGIIAWTLAPPGNPAVATLPDVVGASQAEAEGTLISAGFEVRTEARESSEEDDGVVVEQDSSGGSEAEESSTVEITVGEGPPEPATGYQLAEDDSGNLRVEVPSEWETITREDDILTGEPPGSGDASVGPSITASSDLDAFENASEVPGIYVLASKELARRFPDDLLIVSGPNDYSDSCERGASEDFERDPYSGRMQTWECGEDTLLTLAAAPEGRECVVLLQLPMYNEADREVVQHTLETFDVDCGGLP